MKVKVRFRTSLGSRDGVLYGLDHEKCTVGSEHDLDEKKVKQLGGLVEPVTGKPIKAVPPPAKVRGVKEGEEFLKDFKERETNK